MFSLLFIIVFGMMSVCWHTVGIVRAEHYPHLWKQALSRLWLVLKMLFPRGRQWSLLPFSLLSSLCLRLYLSLSLPPLALWLTETWICCVVAPPPSASSRLSSLPLCFALACALRSADKEYSPDGQQLESLGLSQQTKEQYYLSCRYVCLYLVCQEAREATCTEQPES